MIPKIDRAPASGKEGWRKHTVVDPGTSGLPAGAEFKTKVEFADDADPAGTPANRAAMMELLAASGTTAGTASALTLAQEGFALADGATVRIKLHTAIGAGATLNVAGTGAKAIVDSKGAAVRAGAVSGAWLTLIYNGTNFVLQGEGGGAAGKYGNGLGKISTFELFLNGYDPFYGR